MLDLFQIDHSLKEFLQQQLGLVVRHITQLSQNNFTYLVVEKMKLNEIGIFVCMCVCVVLT